MMIGAMSIIRTAYRNELAEFRAARASGDYVGAWHRLERGHIIAQGSLPLHLHSHVVMLAFAVSQREWSEVAGQALRLFLAPLGTLTGRTPIGSTGRSDVSAFATMPIPADIAQIVNAGRD
ncbi:MULTISPECIES: DUF3703 domain-containing protein [Erythrobacter]|jgi:hypothetical protein|uniref:DUF3703 domain-containing protein n=1 Tax=Erythrobacter TaxID=1041 RepID=UPI000B206025|nr:MULTISPECIES: DUF3703 domain-containing protein [Erythrobacter]